MGTRPPQRCLCVVLILSTDYQGMFVTRACVTINIRVVPCSSKALTGLSPNLRRSAQVLFWALSHSHEAGTSISPLANQSLGMGRNHESNVTS